MMRYWLARLLRLAGRWDARCDRCDTRIEAKVPHVTVTRHVEKFTRGAISVLDADVLLTLCMACDAEHPVAALELA